MDDYNNKILVVDISLLGDNVGVAYNSYRQTTQVLTDELDMLPGVNHVYGSNIFINLPTGECKIKIGLFIASVGLTTWEQLKNLISSHGDFPMFFLPDRAKVDIGLN